MQGIQLVLPQGAIFAKPLVDIGKWLRSQAVDPALGVLANLD